MPTLIPFVPHMGLIGYSFLNSLLELLRKNCGKVPPWGRDKIKRNSLNPEALPCKASFRVRPLDERLHFSIRRFRTAITSGFFQSFGPIALPIMIPFLSIRKVVGIPFTSKRSRVSHLGSIKTGKV